MRFAAPPPRPPRPPRAPPPTQCAVLLAVAVLAALTAAAAAAAPAPAAAAAAAPAAAAVAARPVAAAQRQDDEPVPARESITHFLLNHEQPSRQVVSTFKFKTPPELQPTTSMKVFHGKGTVTGAEIVQASFQSGGTDFIVTSKVDFNGLPGLADVRVYMSTPNATESKFFRHVFYVVGVALYTGQPNERSWFSGPQAEPLVLKQSPDGFMETTVNAAVYDGAKIEVGNLTLNKDNLRITVTPNNSTLAWSDLLCRIATDPKNLNSSCTMAFNKPFTQFTLRVPVEAGSPARDNRISFEWEGLREYFKIVEEESPGASGGSATTTQSSDYVVDARVMLSNPKGSQAGWKIAIIVVTGVLLGNALVTLIFFVCRGRGRGKKNKNSLNMNTTTTTTTPDGKLVVVKTVDSEYNTISPQDVRPPGRGRWPAFALLRRPESVYYVEEPSSDGTLLMLEGQRGGRPWTGGTGTGGARTGGAHSGSGDGGGDEGERKEESVERLVLPGGLERGVDLEPGIMGGPDADEDERKSGQGGLSSVMFPHDGDRRSRERSANRDRGKPVVHGVGSAINRIRQVDLLHGPHTRGLVGRNGELIHGREEVEDEGGPKTAFSVSTVS